jgi:hypothetical protein
MVERINDPQPSPKGGRAAERLRQFENARRPAPEVDQDQAEEQPPCDEDSEQLAQQKQPKKAKDDEKSG